MTKTYGSLFAGVGGFDMGFEQAGFKCLFQVEWDKHCQNVLNLHWPDVPKWGDVCSVRGDELSPVDVLIFGSPCQDLSVAGKRSGLGGEKSSMFFEAMRIIKEMKDATNNTYPKVAVWENVPGALTSNKGEDFQAVLNEMADCGSHITEWAVLDAQHFGVPQRRRRIFLVAILDSATASRCPDPLFPLAEGRRGDYSKGIPKGESVTGTPSESARGSQSTAVKVIRSGARDAEGNLPAEVWKEIDLAPTLNSMDNGGESRATVIAFTTQQDSTPDLLPRMDTDSNMIVENNAYSIREDAKANTFSATLTDTALCINAHQPSVQSHHAQLFIAQTVIPIQEETTESSDTIEPIITFTAQRVGEAPRIYEDSTPTLTAHMGTGGNNTPMTLGTIPTEQAEPQSTIAFGWQENHYAGDTHEEITTALTTTKTQAIHQPEHAVRRLTPLECERLMGWPDDHTRWKPDGTEQADSHRYKQCGNGVATPVARWVASQIVKIL